MKLFSALPANLSEVTDDELAALTTDRVEGLAKIKANDGEFIGDASAAEVIAELKAGREQYDTLKAEQAARVEAQTNFQAEVDALTSGVEELNAETGDETAADDDATETADEDATEETGGETTAEAEEIAAEAAGAEAVVAGETEVVTADAGDPPTRLVRPPAVPKQHQPLPGKTGTPLVASAGLESVRPGQVLDKPALERALIEAARRHDVRPGAADVVVASAKWEYPEDRILDPRDSQEHLQQKIDAVVGEEALTASGGLCAPRSVRYELDNIAVADRPVRDALPSFQAVRGGLQFGAAPSIGDITSAVGKITAAQDAAGGSSGTKTCQTVICPNFSTVDVAAIYHCLSAGNLGARAYPEQLAQFTELVLAAHARVAETALLDLISAGSTAVTASQIGGATSSLFPAMLAAAAGIRSHYRMATDATLRVLLPAWSKDLLKADIVRQPFDKFQLSDGEMIAIIRSFNLEPSFYMDGETSGGQVFGAQAGGALNPWPTTVKWFIFPEGTWLYLDGGTLELGLVRDSTLNATNTFQEFGETWESVAKTGVVSYEVTSTVFDTGTLTAPAALATTAY